jgi:NADH-quinone oxidoreductase subunit I
MSIFSDIWDGVKTTMIGLKITLPYITRKPVTRMYPHERPEMPERVRNRLYVNMDDCIGCDQCSRACPVNCISIETAKAVEDDPVGVTSNGKRKALWVTRFDIDIAKCCYCGLCTFPCPTECIKMTDIFEFSEQERNNLIYSYITLTPDEVREKVEKAEQAEREAEEKKAAAAKEKAAQPDTPPAATPAPKPAAPVTDDPEKAAKLAEPQAKMAAAKAAKEGGTPAAAPSAASAAPASADSDKAAKLAELQAKMAAAKAKREAESGAAPQAETVPHVEPPTPAPPAEPELPEPSSPAKAKNGSSASVAGSDEDAEKAARIAALQAKIAEAKAKKEGG